MGAAPLSTPTMTDPATRAWIILAAYGCCALLALAAGRSAASTRDRRFWYSTAAVLLLLGLNKQLDMQTMLTDVARSVAKEGGWYDSGESCRARFLLVLGLGAAAAAAMLTLWLRSASRAVKIATTGLLLLMGFVLLRAASFHHIDAWVTVDLGGLRSGWWLELAGIALIGASAAAQRVLVSEMFHRRRGRPPRVAN